MPKESLELIETLLNRGALWRGRTQQNHFSHKEAVVSTHFSSLDQNLAGGWPSHGGIELCVPAVAVEWHLLAKPLAQVTSAGQLGVLINPPHEFMACKLLNEQIHLANLWIIETRSNADFVASTVECLHTHSCAVVVAWEPKGMQYAHLRKCLMACANNPGLFFLVRNAFARRNSSPAILRLMLKQQQDDIEVEIFKQKGLVEPKFLRIALPSNLRAKMPLKLLGGKKAAPAYAEHKLSNAMSFKHEFTLGASYSPTIDSFKF